MPLDLDTWIHVAAESAVHIAGSVLDAHGCDWQHRGDLPGDLHGAYVTLRLPNASMDLGVAATLEHCHQVARTMLQLGSDEPDVAGHDLNDVLGEIANMVAGGLKQRLIEQVQPIGIGTPVALQGQAHPLSQVSTRRAVLRLPTSELWLVLSGPESAGIPH